MNALKKVGKVSMINKKGDLLVKSDRAHRIGTFVVNQQIKNIGKIVDIIGPTNAPYILINTREAAAKAKKGELVYLLDKSPQRSKSQKKKPPSKYHKTAKKGRQFSKKS